MLKKILAFYMKFFALWVVLFGVVAYFFPDPFLAVKSHNQLFFAITMFGIGAVLSIEDFKRIAERPVIVVIGSAAQFIIMPLGAFAFSKAFNLPPEIAIGLIIAGSAPGAMASNVMCYIGRADTAYSVSLTTVSTLLCPLLTPGLTKLLAGATMEVEFWPLFFSVVKMVVLPLALGFSIRHFFSRAIDSVKEIFPAISATFIVFITSLVIAMNKQRLSSGEFGWYLLVILAVVLLLNIYGMCAGYGVGTLFRMQQPRRRTLCIEIGMQNAGLGTVLALEHFGEKATIAPAMFVFVCIITASLLVEFWQRTEQAKPDEQIAHG